MYRVLKSVIRRMEAIYDLLLKEKWQLVIEVSIYFSVLGDAN
jgi:hypothetical protein